MSVVNVLDIKRAISCEVAFSKRVVLGDVEPDGYLFDLK
jgi:hypothetical protein